MSVALPAKSDAVVPVDAEVGLALAQEAALRRWHTSAAKRRRWLVRRALVLADVVGLALAFALAQWLATGLAPGDWSPSAEVFLFVAMLPVWVVLAHSQGLYSRDDERTDYSTADDIGPTLQLVTLGTWVFFVSAWATGLAAPPIGRMVSFWALAITLVPAARATARGICRRRPTYLQNAVIVGAGAVGQRIAQKYRNHPEYGINVVGFVDGSPRERQPGLIGGRLLGSTEELVHIIRHYTIERVVIAFSQERPEQTVALVRSVKDLDVQVDIVPRLYELLGAGATTYTVEGVPVVGLPPLRLSPWARSLKRTFDLTLSALALVLLAPLFALIAVLIRLDSRGPVLFRQPRVGTGGRFFTICKFRTMWFDADARKTEFAHLNRHAAPGGDPRMFKIDDDPRMTRMGRLLRTYSLDELPQLFNVVKGEMSLVGPRPLIAEEDQYVLAWARKRLDLKPGITGLWQVQGRSSIPFEEMVRLDYVYVTTWSLWRDFLLLLRTVPVIMRGSHN